jgi:hypothetical protein
MRRDSAYVACCTNLPCSIGSIKYKAHLQFPPDEVACKWAVVGRKLSAYPCRLYRFFRPTCLSCFLSDGLSLKGGKCFRAGITAFKTTLTAYGRKVVLY